MWLLLFFHNLIRLFLCLFFLCCFVCNDNVTHTLPCVWLFCPLSLCKSHRLICCCCLSSFRSCPLHTCSTVAVVTVSFTCRFITVRSECGFIWWGQIRAVIFYVMVIIEACYWNIGTCPLFLMFLVHNGMATRISFSKAELIYYSWSFAIHGNAACRTLFLTQRLLRNINESQRTVSPLTQNDIWYKRPLEHMNYTFGSLNSHLSPLLQYWTSKPLWYRSARILYYFGVFFLILCISYLLTAKYKRNHLW